MTNLRLHRIIVNRRISTMKINEIINKGWQKANKKNKTDGMGEGDVIPFKNPHSNLDKDALDAWNKERNQKIDQDMITLAPEVVEYYKELKGQGKDDETAIDIIAYDFDIDEYDVKRMLQAARVTK